MSYHQMIRLLSFQVRDSRNTIMHSATMQLNDNDFIAYTDTMIDLLLDPGTLSKTKDAQDAAKNIKEVSLFLILSSLSL